MADMSIDEATLDAQVTGVELLPASDGGNPRAVSTEKIKDYVLAQIAALTAASGVDADADKVYILKGGEVKPVAASVLAAAVLDVAYTLSQIVDINGNETVALKDGNSGKKTATLTQLKSWITSGLATTAALSTLETTVGGKVDKVEGKGLSKNDYTDTDKAKLDALVTNTQADWNESDNTSPAFIKNKPTIPETITVDETLDETSANAIANNAVATAVSGLQDDIEDLDNGKVDKVTGKGLSTNDYTTAEKTKLAGLPTSPVYDVKVDGVSVVSEGVAEISLPKVHFDDESPSGAETGYPACSIWIEQPSGGGNIILVNAGDEASADWFQIGGQ